MYIMNIRFVATNKDQKELKTGHKPVSNLQCFPNWEVMSSKKIH